MSRITGKKCLRSEKGHIHSMLIRWLGRLEKGSYQTLSLIALMSDSDGTLW